MTDLSPFSHYQTSVVKDLPPVVTTKSPRSDRSAPPRFLYQIPSGVTDLSHRCHYQIPRVDPWTPLRDSEVYLTWKELVYISRKVTEMEVEDISEIKNKRLPFPYHIFEKI